MNYLTHELSDGFIDNQFDRIDPERHRELSRKGGIASGLSRRRKATRRDIAFDMLASYDLARTADEEYRAAVEKVMEAEKRKRARRKATDK